MATITPIPLKTTGFPKVEVVKKCKCGDDCDCNDCDCHEHDLSHERKVDDVHMEPMHEENIGSAQGQGRNVPILEKQQRPGRMDVKDPFQGKNVQGTGINEKKEEGEDKLKDIQQSLTEAYEQGKKSAEETYSDYKNRVQNRWMEIEKLAASKKNEDNLKFKEAVNKYNADYEEAKKNGKDRLAYYYEQAKNYFEHLGEKKETTTSTSLGVDKTSSSSSKPGIQEQAKEKANDLATQGQEKLKQLRESMANAYEDGKEYADESYEQFRDRVEKRWNEIAKMAESRKNEDKLKFQEAMNKYNADWQQAKNNGKDKLAYYYEQAKNYFEHMGQGSSTSTNATSFNTDGTATTNASTSTKPTITEQAKTKANDVAVASAEKLQQLKEAMANAYEDGKESAGETYEQFRDRVEKRWNEIEKMAISRKNEDKLRFQEAVNKYNADWQEAKSNGKDKLAYYYAEAKNYLQHLGEKGTTSNSTFGDATDTTSTKPGFQEKAKTQMSNLTTNGEEKLKQIKEKLVSAYEQGKEYAEETYEQFKERIDERWNDSERVARSEKNEDKLKLKEILNKYNADFQQAKENGKEHLAYYYAEAKNYLQGLSEKPQEKEKNDLQGLSEKPQEKENNYLQGLNEKPQEKEKNYLQGLSEKPQEKENIVTNTA